jgi:hypothetical protein
VQRLLTEEEYQELLSHKREDTKAYLAKLQSLCTLAAIHVPVEVSWRNAVEPWGCILDVDSNPTYCDHCPARPVCPNENKRLSK